MKELFEQIERFQALKQITGASKSSSYSVTIQFDPWSDQVVVEFGGYDVGSWDRHTYIQTTKDSLIKDITTKVDEAVVEVEREKSEGYYD